MSTAFAVSITLFSSVSWTQEDIPVENWSLPDTPSAGTRSLMAATSNQSTFIAVTPCRIADTRNAGSVIMQANETRVFSISGSACGVPIAGAYSLNFTVVPSGPLGYLTAWPTGSTQPTVSTLNSPNGAILANAAIVPASNGSINVFVTNYTHVVIDINGYFDAATKVCASVVFGNWRDTLPVPQSWTASTCASHAAAIGGEGAYSQLGCIFSNSSSFAPTGVVPSPNCGW